MHTRSCRTAAALLLACLAMSHCIVVANAINTQRMLMQVRERVPSEGVASPPHPTLADEPVKQPERAAPSTTQPRVDARCQHFHNGHRNHWTTILC